MTKHTPMDAETRATLAAMLRTAARYEREHTAITFDHGWRLIDAVAAHGDELARAIRSHQALVDALELFERQWNARGPNSDFGRYFQNVRDAARAAIAKAEG